MPDPGGFHTLRTSRGIFLEEKDQVALARFPCREAGLGHQAVGVRFDIGLKALHEFGYGLAGCDDGQEFDDGEARFAQDAAFGPEDPDVGRDRDAGLAKLFVKEAVPTL